MISKLYPFRIFPAISNTVYIIVIAYHAAVVADHQLTLNAGTPSVIYYRLRF